MKKIDTLFENIIYKESIEQVLDLGQGHIFNWWNELSEDERKALLNQISNIDFTVLEKAIREYKEVNIKKSYTHLKPAKSIVLRGATLLSSEKLGEQAIKDGRVCSLVFAGGQGTRLGFKYPKGVYPISSISGKSLFELFAEKIRFVSERYGRSNSIPWYIMTSVATDTETKSFFKKNKFFGLEDEAVCFFIQGLLPAIDFRGKLIMDLRHHFFENPDGHGGVIKALGENGNLEEMAKKGIEYIFIHNVDNPLTKVCDPAFIGYHIATNADFSCRSILRQSEDESLGLIVQAGGRIKILEYTDIPKYFDNRKTEKEKLAFRHGNTNIYVINVNFLKQLYQEKKYLPIHYTRKKIPMIDASGNLQYPQEPNGLTLETKIFDALEYAERSNVVEGNRAEDFSPLKNKDGTDSYIAVLHDTNELFTGWLEAAGILIPKEKVNKIEISPMFAIDLGTFKEKVASIGRSELRRLIEEQIKDSGNIFL